MLKKLRLGLLFLFLSLFLSGCLNKNHNLVPSEGGEVKMGKLSGKKVLMVLAPKDFRDEEFFKTRVALQAAGAEVLTAAQGVEEALGVLGGKVKIDVDLAAVNLQDYAALVFVGGTGAQVYFNQESVLALVRGAFAQKKVIGAICIAPSILANAGILKDKKVTSFPSEEKNLVAAGAHYTGQAVEVDGRLVTANGPQAAEAFGEKLVAVLEEN
jgi:protease I